ncbi:hypothetical protein HanRHA438_Chr01g0043531 [Helianthus annuus]|nr:hypothetical protein HanRHA438_Chr01g0043531 [Helianthus annuus]
MKPARKYCIRRRSYSYKSLMLPVLSEYLFPAHLVWENPFRDKYHNLGLTSWAYMRGAQDGSSWVTGWPVVNYRNLCRVALSFVFC